MTPMDMRYVSSLPPVLDEKSNRDAPCPIKVRMYPDKNEELH
jgi:hypothetical protein